MRQAACSAMPTRTILSRARLTTIAQRPRSISAETCAAAVSARHSTARSKIFSRAQNLFNLYACIGEPIVPDEYLTDNSIRFHEHLGFRRIGVFERCGYKFGRWYNMVWAEKLLAAHPVQPKAVVPFSALDSAAVRGILCRHSTL